MIIILSVIHSAFQSTAQLTDCLTKSDHYILKLQLLSIDFLKLGVVHRL